MYGIKEVGRYNVNYAGEIYDGKIPYDMVTFERFNGNTPVKNSKRTLYFLKGKDYITPDFNTEEEVIKVLCYRNYTKLQAKKETIIKMV